jgi:diguanylate cyclase (GGDEF)-like protein
MDVQRLARAGTPAAVSVLAVMAFARAAACFAWAAFPVAPDAPRGIMVALGLAGVAMTLMLMRSGADVSPARLHVAVVLFTALTGAMVAVAVTERGLMMSALGYIWTAVYVAFFFRPRVARLYAALTIAALGLSLLAAHAPTDASVWVTFSAMIWVAVAVLVKISTRLRAEAHTDGLTGLLNRTGFAVAAARQRATAERRGEPLALAVVDLDDFKIVNDRGGHAAGDRLLIELAGVWTASLRPGDLLARFGGDEFVLMLAGATEAQVGDLLARLTRAHPASWTVGAVICSSDESLAEAIERADARLYVAKEQRRAARDRARPASAVRSWQPDRGYG